MMRRVKGVHISLILVISFFILMLPVYFNYTSLVEADLFSTDLNFENLDQDVLTDLQQTELKISLSCVLSVVLPPGATLLNQLESFSFQIPSFDQMISILRC